MALRIEADHHTVRVYADDETAAARGDYVATAQVEIHDDTAIISGACGRLRRTDLRVLADELRARGVRYVLAQRVSGRLFPFGKQREEPPFKGWWMMDLLFLFKKMGEKWKTSTV